MKCLHPVRIGKNLDPREFPRGLEVPCGKCKFCLMQKRREWSLRCWHELDAWNGMASFVTLTYADEFLPYSGAFPTLRKKHMQDWIKRVRKNIDYLPGDNRSIAPDGSTVRYFLAGEFGDITQRPHYHALLFGLNSTIETTHYIRETWKYGHVLVLPANYETIKYTAAYIDKKTYDVYYNQKLRELGIEELFNLKSQGLGKYWAAEHIEQIERQGIRLPNGKASSIPRYYINKYKLDVSNTIYAQEQQQKDEIYSVSGMPLTEEQLMQAAEIDRDFIQYVEAYRQYKVSQALATERKLQTQQKLKVRDLTSL